MSKLVIYNMTREEFKNIFMIPLEKEFGYISYWNSKELKNKGIEPISDSYVLGTCYTLKKGRPIVLKYRKNKVAEMLSTLIHEYAHAYLHCYEEDDEQISEKLEEFEANKVSFEVLKHFNISVESEKEVKYYYEKSSKLDKIRYENLKRDWMLIDFQQKVKKAIGESLNSIQIVPIEQNVIYKYKVECKLCKASWKYVRKTNMIKENAKGYYCSLCGKSSMDQLVVYNL